MKTAMVPIVKRTTKNKTRDISDKKISLVTAALKPFEISIPEIFSTYLITNGYKFAYKSKHFPYMLFTCILSDI